MHNGAEHFLEEEEDQLGSPAKEELDFVRRVWV